MVGSYFSMKWPETNWTVSADLPTPPDPSTTTLNSFIAMKLQDSNCQTIFVTLSLSSLTSPQDSDKRWILTTGKVTFFNTLPNHNPFDWPSIHERPLGQSL